MSLPRYNLTTDGEPFGWILRTSAEIREQRQSRAEVRHAAERIAWERKARRLREADGDLSKAVRPARTR